MPNGQPTPPSPPSEEQPLAEPFQNYQKLRQRLNEDFANALPGYMDRGLLGFSEPFRLEQGLGAAGILATRAIKFLPRNTEITQEILSEALIAAQDELAATEDWFDIVLPSRRKRLRLAQELASMIDTQSAAAQAQLQAAALEQDAYADAALTAIPDQEALAKEIQSNLQAEGYSLEEAKQVAGATLLEHEQRAVKYGAAPPPTHFQNTVKQELQRTDKYSREDRYDQVAQKVSESTQEKAVRRAEAIGLNRVTIAKDPNLVGKTFKYARRLPGFEKLNKTLKVTSVVVHPIRAVRKAVIRRVGDAAIKTLIKVLTKLGLGTLVRRVEQAIISVGTGGLGLPIAILQEVVSVGIGRLNRTIKNIARDWKEAIRTGLRNPLEGSIRVLGTAFDNTGAAVGAAVGAGGGAVGGALIGAALGSVIPVLGTAVGGIIGSLVGAFAGAGYGAKKGYELRRKIQRKLMIFLAMRALGLNPFKIAWALLKAAATWALGQIAPLIQTVISRATIGARGLIGIARFGPQVLIQQAAAGEGLLAQGLRGVGNLFGNIPSGIARAFNAVTGWLSGQTVSTAASIEAVTTEVVTAGPGRVLPWASVAGTMGLVFVFSLITYTFLIAVFHVTPTEVVPYQIGPPGGGVVPCPQAGAERDITAELAARITAGVVNLLPPSIAPRNPPYCILPTAIVMHWSAGYDNDLGNDATYNTLVARDLACQVATDTNDTWLMQTFYETMVEMAWCANSWNAFAISSEMAGGCTDSGPRICDRDLSACRQPGDDYSSPDELQFDNPPPHPCLSENDLSVDAICEIMKQYKIPWCQIYGHYHVPDSGGKIDPGSAWLEGYFIPRMRSECPNDPENLCG